MKTSRTDKKSPGSRSLKIRFSLLQFTFWCSWCAFTSFVALYLKHQGHSQANIGLAVSVSTLAGILGQLFWGYLSDRFHTIRRVFIPANLMIAAIILCFLFFRGYPAILLMMALLGFSQVPQPSILDTWILKALPKHEHEYGSIRLWASVGFALFALGFGRILSSFGFSWLFIAPLFFILASLILALMTPDIRRDEKKEDSAGMRQAFQKILHTPSYLFFIGICFIIGLAARTTHLLLPLIIDAVKGNASHLGLALFITGTSEIPMLMLSRRLSKKLKPYSLVLISCLCYGVQFLLLYLARSTLLVFVAMIFQGMAFGNLLPSIRLFVYNHTPEPLRTMAQTITDGICSSLAGVIGSAAGGFIIQNMGLSALILSCLILTGIAFLMALGKTILKKSPEAEARSR